MLIKQCENNSLVKIQIIRIDEKTLDWKYDADNKIYLNVPIYTDKKGRRYFLKYGKEYIDKYTEVEQCPEYTLKSAYTMIQKQTKLNLKGV